MIDTAPSQQRAYWLKTLHKWHWISSAICLLGMLLFAITGITLNHANSINSKPHVTSHHSSLPAPLLSQAQQAAQRRDSDLPIAISTWLDQTLNINSVQARPEWSADEVYLSLPRPGGDAWLSLDLNDGTIEYERTDRGWIAYFNDLHKGRHTGLAWSWFLDIFAVACLIFSLTGLVLLKMHAGHRAATWPMLALGGVIPIVLALVFIH